jgi:hypothetical protein
VTVVEGFFGHSKPVIAFAQGLEVFYPEVPGASSLAHGLPTKIEAEMCFGQVAGLHQHHAAEARIPNKVLDRVAANCRTL